MVVCFFFPLDEWLPSLVGAASILQVNVAVETRAFLCYATVQSHDHILLYTLYSLGLDGGPSRDIGQQPSLISAAELSFSFLSLTTLGQEMGPFCNCEILPRELHIYTWESICSSVENL